MKWNQTSTETSGAATIEDAAAFKGMAVGGGVPSSLEAYCASRSDISKTYLAKDVDKLRPPVTS